MNCSTVKVSWAGQVSNNSHLTGCSFDLQMFSKASPYNSIYRYVLNNIKYILNTKPLATLLVTKRLKRLHAHLLVSQIFKVWCHMMLLLFQFFFFVRTLLFIVLPLVEVLFRKIIFVFCSGLCKEFIVKELRPGTQYKFRLVLCSLHVFSGAGFSGQ